MRKLYRVSAVEYLTACSPEEAADFAAHAWECILNDDGHLHFIIEELAEDENERAPGLEPIPHHFEKLHGEIMGTVNEYTQDNFDELQADVKAQISKKVQNRAVSAPASKRKKGH